MYIKKSLIAAIILIFSSSVTIAQVPADVYKKPLKEVINDIEKKYKIKLQYSESLIKGIDVSYSTWRYRSGTEETLTNILMPLVRWMKVRNTSKNCWPAIPLSQNGICGKQN